MNLDTLISNDAGVRRTLIIFLLLQVLIWTIVPYHFAISLPLDVVSDGITWGREWQWGYFKHPPMQAWLNEAFFVGLGDIGPFLLSQLAVISTYVLVFLLGRKMVPTREALIATLLLYAVYYFSIPSPEFNNNIAQLPLWALAAFAYYQALSDHKLRWWSLLGLAAGLGGLTKYSMIVIVFAIIAHALSSAKSRKVFATPGPYVAILISLAVVFPHIIWLFDNKFPTFTYAASRAGHDPGLFDRLFDPIRFVISQIVTSLLCIIVAIAIGLLRPIPLPSWRDENFRFLVFLGLGPCLITATLSLVSGFGLRDMWGTPMWDLTGLLIVYAMKPRWSFVSMRALLSWIAALFVVLPLCYILATSWGPELEGFPSRTEWPDRAMAKAFSKEWKARVNGPLDIIAGNAWLAGLIAMRMHHQPSVFIDASYYKAPWITPHRLKDEGALVVWQIRKTNAPPARLNLKGLRVMGEKTFAWPREPATPPLKVGWGILPPNP
jgi:4-amino-4-deoxy-L-arabinose transferase-like glycosyltransferase